LFFLRLGFTSFGGPIAHLGYFHDEFVEKRKMDQSPHAYADLVALCQFLPGPASSQVGMALGFQRAGYVGVFGCMAWVYFAIGNSSCCLCYGNDSFSRSFADTILYGNIEGFKKLLQLQSLLKLFLSWQQKLSLGKLRAVLTGVSAISVLYFRSSWTSICLLVLGGFIGAAFLSNSETLPHVPWQKKFF
jgi:chromate transporter